VILRFAQEANDAAGYWHAIFEKLGLKTDFWRFDISS
jgi:hypothetical protein